VFFSVRTLAFEGIFSKKTPFFCSFQEKNTIFGGYYHFEKHFVT